MTITVVGAGLAGCEAAYQIAKRGHTVRLIESKPIVKSPAHHSEDFAELVCSNSLKSDAEDTAGGLLKRELRALDCLLLRIAEAERVPSGGALAVDRERFAAHVTREITANPAIEIVRAQATDWDTDAITVLATGPLTHAPLAACLLERVGGALAFYDAAAPVLDAMSIDGDKCFSASRYDKGDADYLNCPMDKQTYDLFVAALSCAERAELHAFDKREIFDGCMPIEIMAERGKDSLRFGPLRPVGFTDPATGRRPYAVVQLRAENVQKTMYNMVGFQTGLKFGEQKRVFRIIPALHDVEFLRYGVMHRNTYLDAPRTLDIFSRLRKFPKTWIAGQLSGVEGYVESIASGLYCGINAARVAEGRSPIALPPTTVSGALFGYLTTPTQDFQPMNANFGILPPLHEPIRDKALRKRAYCTRALRDLTEMCEKI